MKQGFYQYYKLTIICFIKKKRMIELNEMDDILRLAFFQFIIISTPHKFV